MNDKQITDNQDFIEAVKAANPPNWDFDASYNRAVENSKVKVEHTPYQEGPYLVCKSCRHKHSLKYIGSGVSFKGLDKEGNIILVNRF